MGFLVCSFELHTFFLCLPPCTTLEGKAPDPLARGPILFSGHGWFSVHAPYVVLYGPLWSSMAPYMALYGTVWHYMALHGPVWRLYGTKLSYMALYGPVLPLWPFLVLHALFGPF